MVEAGTLGGTCVNVGCVPSKFLLRAAEIVWQAGHHPFAGVRTQALGVDLGALSAQKQRLLDHLRQEKYADLIPAYGWEFRQGTATFADPETLLVDGQPLRARAYLIATGASPAIPPIPGLVEAGYLTSTTALDLTALPRSLAVIGGNAIGLELGQAFQRLGSRVVLFELLPRIAPFEEPEISQTLAEALRAEGMAIVTAAQVGRVERLPDGQRQVTATVDGQPRTWIVEAVLVATGRRPNTAGLGLERAGIQTDRRGAVVVDETLRTTNPRVWAAGDVAGAPQFVYVAASEGALAAENSLTGAGRRVDFTALPRVTFTSPQIAAVGPTEAEARAQGQTVRTALLPLSVLARAGQRRDARALQAAGRRPDRPAHGGAHSGRERRRGHLRRRPGHQGRPDRRRPGGQLRPLPDHGRGAAAGRPGLQPGRGAPLLLRLKGGRMGRRMKGLLLVGLALVTCPCHLPLLVLILAGTGLGALLAAHLGLAAAVLTVVFLVALGLHLLTAEERTPPASADCCAPARAPAEPAAAGSERSTEGG